MDVVSEAYENMALIIKILTFHFRMIEVLELDSARTSNGGPDGTEISYKGIQLY